MEDDSQRPDIAIFVSSFMAHCIKMYEKIIYIYVYIYIFFTVTFDNFNASLNKSDPRILNSSV